MKNYSHIEKSFNRGKYVCYDPTQGGKAVNIFREGKEFRVTLGNGETYRGTLTEIDNRISKMIQISLISPFVK
jgi:hypothetical protein